MGRGFILPEQLTGHALRSFCIDVPDNPEYRRAFWGHLYELTKAHVWQNEGVDYDTAEQAAAYWRQIVHDNAQRFDSGQNCYDEGQCFSYGPDATFIQWFPNNPYLTPDLVGEGYNAPAWYIAAGTINEPIGAVAGDALTDITRFPQGSLPDILPASGLPRFRVNVNGVGVVRLKCANIAGGSLIQTTIDDNPLTVQFSDINLDVLSFPAETDNESVLEIEIDTPGPHHIDCIIVSKVNEDFPFLFHGGGLREVELCGDTIVPNFVTTPVRFDQASCSFQQSQDGGETWEDIPGNEFIMACFQGMFDDEYVNESGDTMTGPLHIRAGTYVDGLTIKGDEGASGIEFSPQVGLVDVRNIDPGFGFQFRSDDVFLRLADSVFLGSDDGSGGTLTPRAAFNLHSDTRSVVNLWAKAGSIAEYIRGVDNNSMLRFLITRLGIARVAALQAYGYTSTDSWQQQFSLAGFWETSTHALRRGGAILSLSDYAGERTVFKADYDPLLATQPRVAFFDGEGSFPANLLVPDDETALGQVIDQLNRYGLTDIAYSVASPKAGADALSGYDKCNSAHYIAEQLADLIGDVLTNLTIVSIPEIMTGLLDDYGVPFGPGGAIVAAASTELLQASNIDDDLTDPTIIADQLYATDFELAAMLTWIDGYGSFYDATKYVLKAVLTALWPSVVTEWIDVGRFVHYGACGDVYETMSCDSHMLDFTLGLTHGAELVYGNIAAGQGVVNEDVGDGWRQTTRLLLSGCTFDQIRIEVLISNNQQYPTITLDTGTPGNYTQVGTQSWLGLSNGRQWLSMTNPSQYAGITRVRVAYGLWQQETDTGNRLLQLQLVTA